MARISISNSWGAGIDMSAYTDDGWGYEAIGHLSGTLYQGYNNIIFNSSGYSTHDYMGFNYYLYPDNTTVILEDIWFFQGDTPVQRLDDVNVLTTIPVLNNDTILLRFNQGNDTFYGNDYADYIKAGFGNDLVVGYLGNDTLYGNEGDDTLGGGGGNDLLVGGDGYDTASFGGASTNYVLTKNTDGSVTITDKTGGWGTDILYGVEAFYFDDGTFSLSSLLPADLQPPDTQPPVTTPPADPFGGSDGAETIVGNSANNRIKGFGGNDLLKGGSGNDFLYGGLGNDKLYGGSGKDAFVFDTKPNKYSNKDTIYDFKVVDDAIRLDNAVFTKVGANGTLKEGAFWASNDGRAHDSSDRIIYDTDGGQLYYDLDGSGKAAAVQFAQVSKNLMMTYKDFYIV